MADGDGFSTLELEDGLDADADGATSIWEGAESTKALPQQAKGAAAVATSGSKKNASKSASHARVASSNKEKRSSAMCARSHLRLSKWQSIPRIAWSTSVQWTA